MALETKEVGVLDGPNGGYVKELLLIRKEDVEFLENPILFPNMEDGYVFIPGSLKLKAADVLFKIAFAWRRCQFSSNAERAAHGFLYNTLMIWDWPRNRPAIDKFLIDHEQDEFVAFFKDGNDCYHIAGNNDVGLELTYGKAITDVNTTIVNLQGLLTFPILQTSEADLELLFQLIEFSTEFSTDFNA